MKLTEPEPSPNQAYSEPVLSVNETMPATELLDFSWVVCWSIIVPGAPATCNFARGVPTPTATLAEVLVRTALPPVLVHWASAEAAPRTAQRIADTARIERRWFELIMFFPSSL